MTEGKKALTPKGGRRLDKVEPFSGYSLLVSIHELSKGGYARGPFHFQQIFLVVSFVSAVMVLHLRLKKSSDVALTIAYLWGHQFSGIRFNTHYCACCQTCSVTEFPVMRKRNIIFLLASWNLNGGTFKNIQLVVMVLLFGWARCKPHTPMRCHIR